MVMTREELQAAFTEMLTMAAPEHQARASELLANVQNSYQETLAEQEAASNRAAELTTANEQLRSANMQLFLQVGKVPKDTEAPPGPKQTTEPEPEPQTPSFDDLFNEKGELK